MESIIQQKPLARQLFRSKIYTVLWITFFWLFVSFYQYFDRYAILLDNSCIDDTYPHLEYIQGLFISLILGGLFGGSALVFLWEKWLRRMPFFNAIAYMVGWYTILNLTLTLIAILTYQGPDSPLNDQPFHKAILPALFNINLLPNFLFWLGVVFLTLVFLLIRDKFGPGMFIAFLRGKYFRPRREERIFMFMDLRSSTTNAEDLEEEKYFNFLSDTFETATPGILGTKGEIYQYVGDEIVISWPMESGLKDDNCISCYYHMMSLINQRAAYFETTYNVKPHFKAGLHAGYVIAGEVGMIKREIVYTGDVLNTTARIQSKCNEMGVDLLISQTLANALNTGKELIYETLGALDLKGKSKMVEVATVHLKQPR